MIYFWKTLITPNRFLALAKKRFIVKLQILAEKRLDVKIRKVQTYLGHNFLSRVSELKVRRCFQIIQATIGPQYNLKEHPYNIKAKQVISRLFKAAHTGMKFKNNCLAYVMRTRLILNRFINSNKVKKQYRLKIKPIVDKHVLALLKYDNFLDRKEQINISKKISYYKNEDSFLQFVIDITKIELLSDLYAG